ncbi:MAG: hypothetical protein IKL90_04560 [Alphaproteobacteria bacterium]|nr:hypothetical protein [Alphaproteobacteria bacterium]
MKYKTLNNRPKITGLKCGPGMTEQNHMVDCDVNTTVARYVRTGAFGAPNEIPTNPPDFSGFDQNFSFFKAQCMVAKAQQEFDALPSSIRSRFDNNPGKLISFLEDSSNQEEAVKLGLVEAPAIQDSNGVIHTTQTPPSQGSVVGNSEPAVAG